jgi:hypothetical protein
MVSVKRKAVKQSKMEGTCPLPSPSSRLLQSTDVDGTWGAAGLDFVQNPRRQCKRAAYPKKGQADICNSDRCAARMDFTAEPTEQKLETCLRWWEERQILFIS